MAIAWRPWGRPSEGGNGATNPLTEGMSYRSTETSAFRRSSHIVSGSEV